MIEFREKNGIGKNARAVSLDELKAIAGSRIRGASGTIPPCRG
jgi:hypothetical protein